MSDDDEYKLSGLSDEEFKILKEKFNLVDNDIPSLDDGGEEFDVTRERIRKIEEKALRRLRGYKNTETGNTLSCSFCNRTKNKVRRLIASNSGATICDECINICVNLLNEQDEK